MPVADGHPRGGRVPGGPVTVGPPTDVTPLELMARQARALFHHDDRGRIDLVADTTLTRAEREPAPRFFLGRTPVGNLWRIGAGVDDSLAAALDALCRTEPPLAEVGIDTGEPGIAAQVRALLGPAEESRGPSGVIPVQPADRSASAGRAEAAGRAAVMTASHAALLRPSFPWTAQRVGRGASEPVAAVVVDGHAVCVCATARWSEEPGGLAEAGVDTVEAYRRRGFAVEACQVWAEAVRASGRLPAYSTSWDNLASRSVAATLGVEFFGEDWSID